MAEKILKLDSGGPESATVEMSVRDNVSVHVPGKGTSGYKWSASTEASNLVVEKQPPLSPATEQMGASAAERFAVQPKAAGEYEVQLQLKRPWENTPAETRTVRLRVTE